MTPSKPIRLRWIILLATLIWVWTLIAILTSPARAQIGFRDPLEVGRTTKDINSSFNLPSGMTLRIKPGATLQLDAGFTLSGNIPGVTTHGVLITDASGDTTTLDADTTFVEARTTTGLKRAILPLASATRAGLRVTIDTQRVTGGLTEVEVWTHAGAANTIHGDIQSGMVTGQFNGDFTPGVTGPARTVLRQAANRGSVTLVSNGVDAWYVESVAKKHGAVVYVGTTGDIASAQINSTVRADQLAYDTSTHTFGYILDTAGTYSFQAFGNDGTITSFVDAAARAAATPAGVNQMGVQDDDGSLWRGVAVTPGAWVAVGVAGGGTVTDVTVTPTGGLTASVASSATTPALTLGFGATITPANVAATGALSGTNFTGSSTGVNTGDQTNIAGNAATATKLLASVTINDVSFDGAANVIVPASANTLTGSTLAAGVTDSSLQSVGALSAGSAGTGFAINLGQVTLTGTLPAARLPGKVTATFADATARAAAAPSGDGQLGVQLNTHAVYIGTGTGAGAWMALPSGGGGGGGGDLLAANNLGDLANVATARMNLGLGTAATTAASAYEVPLTFSGGLSRTGNAIVSLSGTVTFADEAARTAAVPAFNGQFAIQVDTGSRWFSIGASAGQWADFDAATTIRPIGIEMWDSITGGGEILLHHADSYGTTPLTVEGPGGSLLTISPSGDLTTTGVVTAFSFAGNGSGLTGLPAAALTGTVDPARMGSGGAAGKFLRFDNTWQIIAAGGDALVANPLSQFAATSSAQVRGVLSDESGTGNVLTTNGNGTALAFGDISLNSVNAVFITAPALGVLLDTGYASLAATSGSSLLVNAGSAVTIGAPSAAFLAARETSPTAAVQDLTGGTAPVANGTYTVGIGAFTNGTITITNGIITAVQEAN